MSTALKSDLENAFVREGSNYPILMRPGVYETVRSMLRCVDGEEPSLSSEPTPDDREALEILRQRALGLNDETRVAFRSFVSRYSGAEDGET